MMKFIKKNLTKSFSRIAFITYGFIVPIVSFAQDTPGLIKNPIEADSINGLIKTLLEGVIKIGMPIVALAIIYCGFLFVAARGKPEAITKAKDALLYTLIGSAVLLGSWAIAQMISETVLSL
ncbi:MAG TPA: TrbC/VirB2 family protein [Gammaproteobacteria bacterium]|uniref:Uncharacterized protein n=1 Tax=Candidatus Nomurabacteria bacterium RIFCSPHIGHO2_01_FULL_40_12 TaxID=1801737 RepID=A0A1F6V0S8_9BACT|nr:MAG: hypothetical protein A2818_02790 [Candidatus Nomurabacteria bacterium RIFCSPHIGHO2_01_FULL_40_12]HLF66459.1 TrbC/VirB2 family protein [Gammaproteobacteria bacterium]